MDIIPSPNTPNGEYKDYDPVTRQKGTAVTKDMLLNPQREIVNVIKDAGLTPDQNDLTQLSQAVKKISALPVQSGNTGKYLKTDGANPSWDVVDALPPQSTATYGQVLKSTASGAVWDSSSTLILGQAVAFNFELTGDDAKGWALMGSMVSGQNATEALPILAQAYESGEDYIKEVPWTQPIATGYIFQDPTGLGNVEISASSEEQNNLAWKALDGIKTGTTAGLGWNNNNVSNPQWWMVKLPYKICITELKGYKNYGVDPATRNTTGQFYTDSSKKTAIGNEYINNGGNWNAVSVTGIPSDGIITDTIYFEKTGGGQWAGLGELEITAMRVLNQHYAGITGLKQATAVKKGFLIAPYSEANKAALDALWNAGKEANVWLLDEAGGRFMCPRTHNWTANTTGVNDFIPESLPNVRGRTPNGTAAQYNNVTDPDSAIYKDAINHGYYETNQNTSGDAVVLDLSRNNKTYKDGAPVQQNASTVYMYYKIYDTIKPSADIVVNDLTQILTDLQALENNKSNVDLSNVSEETARTAAKNRVWISDEYAPVSGTRTIVTHGLNLLNPLLAQGEILLKCIVADCGYVPGEYMSNWANCGEASGTKYPQGRGVTITKNTVETSTGWGLTGVSKSGSTAYAWPNINSWRYVFKIIY